MFRYNLGAQVLIPTNANNKRRSQVFFSQCKPLRRRWLDSRWPGDTPWCYRLLPLAALNAQVLLSYNSSLNAGYCRSAYAKRRFAWLGDLTHSLKAQYSLQYAQASLKAQVLIYNRRGVYAVGDFTHNRFCDEDFCSSGLFYGVDAVDASIYHCQVRVLLQARNHLSSQVLIPNDGKAEVNMQTLLLINNLARLQAQYRQEYGTWHYDTAQMHTQVAWYPKAQMNTEITIVYREGTDDGR